MTRDWREDLVQFLIKGGTVGWTRTEIMYRFRARANAASVDNELNVLHLEDKVQKFQKDSERGGGKTVIWRATNKLTV